jgi:hypothetical protein
VGGCFAARLPLAGLVTKLTCEAGSDVEPFQRTVADSEKLDSEIGRAVDGLARAGNVA